MANKFVSVLASIGNGFRLGAKKAVQLEVAALPTEEKVADLVADVDPNVGDTLERILEVVGLIEQVATAVESTSGNGQQKLAVALPLIEQTVLRDPIFKGKTIADPEAFNAAVEKFASSFVDMVNATESAVAAGEAAVKAAVTPAPTAPVAAAPAIKVPVAV